MRWGVTVAALVAALFAATAQPADSSRYLRVGIYDEAQTLYGPVDKTMITFEAAARAGVAAQPLLGSPTASPRDVPHSRPTRWILHTTGASTT